MAVISITISEAPRQNVAGIPESITLTTNIPATIFFTLDGSDPTTSSAVVTGPIRLPENTGTVVLKMFATDGVTTCPIVTESFGTSVVPNRQPHDKISGIPEGHVKPDYPFGSGSPGGVGIFGNTGGVTVDDPAIAGVLDGYDGTATGTHSNETDLPLASYDFIFSETNSQGERGEGIGTVPATATVVIPPPITPLSVGEGSSDANSPLFNPRSMVIFQDSGQDPYDPEESQLNRPNFNLEDVETARNGALLFTGALDGNITRGSALKQQFNPRDNTMTYYYRDADTNRWIISKVPYSPKPASVTNFSTIVFGRDRPTGKVFKWIPGIYRTLW